ncbi:MAG: glycosyltransferase [Planctomycetes bacterium]|nr:glycosyltransferase [Planctomycetota bacterium]
MPTLRAVRIGFDVSPLHRPHPPGIVRVVRETVAALERRGRVEVVRLAPPEGAKLRSWRAHELPQAATELDGLHSFLSAFPLRGPGARVQTIHELPWLHGVVENADLAHRFWNWVGPLRAHAVVTATEYTARDLRARWLPGRARVRVIPWGVGAPFGPALLERVQVIFCPGASRAKKGLAAVIDGVAWLDERPTLVVTGPRTAEFERCELRARAAGVKLLYREHLDEEELVLHYRSSIATALLSHSEGFGLPVLESMACGTPVIVPRDSAQAEVAGPAGLRVDPESPESVASAIDHARGERAELRAKGVERARGVSWNRTAAGIEELWAEILR